MEDSPDMSTEIHLTYHQEAGQWWVEAAELPGFVAVGATLEEVRDLASTGLPEYLGTEDIEVFEVGEHGEAIITRRLDVPGILVGLGLTVSQVMGTSAADPLIQRRPTTTTSGTAATLVPA